MFKLTKNLSTFLFFLVFVSLAHAQGIQQNFHQQLLDPNEKGDSCTSLRTEIPEPRIEVDEKVNGTKSNQIRGYIEGICLTEAGEYANGNRIENITLPKSTEFKRVPFSLQLKNGQSRELRVYNSHGGMASYSIPDRDDSDDPLGIGVQRLD